MATLPSLSNGFSRYLAEIRRFPLLSESEEQRLAFAWTLHEDRKAAHTLVTSHLRLAASISMQYKGYGIPIADLVSEANMGLMRAVKKFDPNRGFRLATYAMWWIRASIQEYILRSWSIVKVCGSASQKRLFFNLRRLRNCIGAFDRSDLPAEDVARIAQTLGVKETEVVDMDRRLFSGGDLSLNIKMRGSDGNEADELQDFIAIESKNHASAYAEWDELSARRVWLNTALETLNERERDILKSRRLKSDPLTLGELSKKHGGISRERVRQIEVRAFEKLCERIQELARDSSEG
jgi:RNA polymerase sigma-32 factor